MAEEIPLVMAGLLYLAVATYTFCRCRISGSVYVHPLRSMGVRLWIALWWAVFIPYDFLTLVRVPNCNAMGSPSEEKDR